MVNETVVKVVTTQVKVAGRRRRMWGASMTLNSTS
jgi:hypothetical protein